MLIFLGGVKKNHIILNQNLTDPAKIISGDINSEAIQWIRANSHRYVTKKVDDTFYICQLDDSNSNLFAGDGTDSSTYLTNYDVFMKLPKFYYHAEEVAPDIWDIGFGQEPEADDWKVWDGKDFIGVYKAFSDGIYLYSRSGDKMGYRYNQATCKSKANNRGAGYSLVKWKHHSMMAFLFYAMYGNTDSQDVCGKGEWSTHTISGQTDAMGMLDTVKDGNEFFVINFWGLENWWGGGRYEWIDNVSEIGGIWTINEDDGATRDIRINLPNIDGTIGKVLIGEYLDMIPTGYVSGFLGEYGFCDGYEIGVDSVDGVLVRASRGDNSESGIAYVSGNIDRNASLVTSNFSSRLAYRGDYVEVSPSEFIALS